MGATNKILAKRVDELTAGLVHIRECVAAAKESDDIDEVAEAMTGIGEDIDDLIAPEDDDRDSEEEEPEEEPGEESEEEE